MKHPNKLSLGLFLLITLFLASDAEARTVVRTGESVSLAENQMVEGDFYGAAGKVNISGSVTEDVLAAGGQVKINGSIGEDATIFGITVDTHGTVGDDLRVVAGEVTIADPVMGDLFVLGGVVTILSTASISGDVIVYAGQLTVEGSVGGDILGSVDTIRVDSDVSGDIDVSTLSLTLGDRANVAGSVKYVSNELAVRAQNAVVGGELIRNDPVIMTVSSTIKTILVPTLVLMFSVLIWFLISKQTLNKVSKRAIIKSPKPILLGCSVILFAPVAISMLLVSVIGSLVGIVFALIYLLLITLSTTAATAVVGQIMMRMFNQPEKELTLITVVVGVVGVSLLMLLPVLGLLLIVGFMILSVGAMVDLLINPDLK